MGEHSSHQAARYMRRGVHNGPGVHPIKHAFAEWHIAPVARKTPIFRPMSRTFKLPAGVTRWFHPFEKLQRDVSSSRYSWKSFPPFPNRNSPTNRNCCKRVTVEIACSSSWIKGKEKERKKEEEEEHIGYTSFELENNDSWSSFRSIDRYRELVLLRGVTSQRNFFTLSNDLFIFIAFHER